MLVLFLFIAGSSFGIAQSNYKTATGEIRFNASTPLEDINALNKVVNAILRSENGDFAAVLLIKDFNLKRKLMQEHFNENYMESETYPKGYFSGNIENFNLKDLSSIPKRYSITGKFTIHGVTKKLTTNIYLSKKSSGILVSSNFIVKPEDYNIEVPKLLFKKIAQEVMVDIKFHLVQY